MWLLILAQVCVYTHVQLCIIVFICCFRAQLFFAKVLRSATEDDVRRLFSKYGRVHDVNLFRAFQGAPTTKASEHVQPKSTECCSGMLASTNV
jgi:hypothetical protein